MHFYSLFLLFNAEELWSFVIRIWFCVFLLPANVCIYSWFPFVLTVLSIMVLSPGRVFVLVDSKY